MEYELFYLVLGSKKENLDTIKTSMKKIVEDAGGTYTGDAVVEDRNIAYHIDKQWRGTYTAQRFTTPDKDTRHEGLGDDELPRDIVAQINKQINLYHDVARYLIVRADELPPLAEKQKQVDENAAQKAREEKKPDVQLEQKEQNIDQDLEKALNL